MFDGNENKAISKILDAYQAALGGESGLTNRHRIEHCPLLDEATLQRMVYKDWDISQLSDWSCGILGISI